MLYLAHNGVDHATEAEAAAHDSGGLTFAWVILAIVVVATMIYALNKVFSRRKK